MYKYSGETWEGPDPPPPPLTPLVLRPKLRPLRPRRHKFLFHYASQVLENPYAI